MKTDGGHQVDPKSVLSLAIAGKDLGLSLGYAIIVSVQHIDHVYTVDNCELRR